MRHKRPDRTLGPGHDDFWAWSAKGELRLQRCTSCEKLLWPVMKACEGCGGDQFTWQRLSGRGKVVSWGTFHQDYYRGVIPVPYETMLVELAEGPLFITNPEGFSIDDARPNMPVEVCFIECEDSNGLFTLPVFAPAADNN